MTSRIAAVALTVLLASCDCGFDAGKLDDLACTSGADCRPDQDCALDTCTQRHCDDVSDCGDVVRFECRDGFCDAVPCDAEHPCGAGAGCSDGFCVPGLPDGGLEDGGLDAAVPCADPSQCDDGLTCTDDACDEGFCSNAVREGWCAVGGACWQGGDVNPANPCQVCRPGSSATNWTSDDARAPNDGIDCTIDRCAGGQPVFEPQDGLCAGGLCSICAGGCVPRPTLTVACPDRPTATGGAPASCAITASPAPALDAGCLSCTTVVGITSLVRDDFEGCPSLVDLGWQGELHNPRCPGPTELGPDLDRGEGQIGITNRSTSLERWFDTTGFDSVRLCFDVASSDEAREPLAVDLNASGVWAEVWVGGVPPAGRLAWHEVCLDLVAFDPLAAGNASVGIRFRPSDQLWGPEIYLDNVAIDAWVSRTIARPGRVFTDEFTGCGLASWTVAGTAPECPVTSGVLVGIDAIGARDSDWTLSRTIDLSDRCDDVRLGFSLAAHDADANERFRASMDRGAGAVALWAIERGPRPDDTLVPVEVPVSHIDPLVRFQPATTLTLRAESGGNTDVVTLDDVWVDGAQCLAAEDLVSAAPPVALEPGTWAIDVVGAARATAAVRCTWDGRADTTASDMVQFCANAECAPGERESQACGTCGSQSHTCDTNCLWLDWSPCADLPCQCFDSYGSCSSCCC